MVEHGELEQGCRALCRGEGGHARRLAVSSPMASPTIRPARADEHDEIARVWMNSWVTTGLNEASDSLLGKLRMQIRFEAENGWNLYVVDDNSTLAAMLVLHVPKRLLGQIFIAPEYQGQGLGRRLLDFTRRQMPEE